MKSAWTGWVLGLFCVAGAIDAQPPLPGGARLVVSENRSRLIPPQRGGEPWLGISVHKASEAVGATLDDVPEGVGFVVSDVVPGGPADQGGLRQYDILWMLDEQVLVNEAQFLVLLHLHKVGETVRLTYHRGDEKRVAQVTLSERPSGETGRPQAEVLIMKGPPMPGLPHQLVEKLRQVASIKGPDGVLVRLERKGEVFQWTQLDSEGDILRRGELVGPLDPRIPVPGNGKLAQKLRALIRAVEDSENRARTGERHPRVRRVPAKDLSQGPNP